MKGFKEMISERNLVPSDLMTDLLKSVDEWKQIEKRYHTLPEIPGDGVYELLDGYVSVKDIEKYAKEAIANIDDFDWEDKKERNDNLKSWKIILDKKYEVSNVFSSRASADFEKSIKVAERAYKELKKIWG